jgi:hypothetical protein
MKKVLSLTAIGMMLAAMGGCRFMECLFRGPPCQQPCQQAVAPVVTCPSCSPCGDPCGGVPVITPTPETYAPVR